MRVTSWQASRASIRKALPFTLRRAIAIRCRIVSRALLSCRSMLARIRRCISKPCRRHPTIRRRRQAGHQQTRQRRLQMRRRRQQRGRIIEQGIIKGRPCFHTPATPGRSVFAGAKHSLPWAVQICFWDFFSMYIIYDEAKCFQGFSVTD